MPAAKEKELEKARALHLSMKAVVRVIIRAQTWASTDSDAI
jgi:hypothetical protein